MKLRHAVALVAILGTILIVTTSGADVVTHQETDVLEIEPVPEDGAYAQIDDASGEIQIILTDANDEVDGAGVNPNALTDIGPVFTIENVLEQQHEATVWIEHDAEGVEFYVDDCGDCVETEDDGLELQPGDEGTVSLRVDTTETDEIDLTEITVMAELDPAVDDDAPPVDDDAPPVDDDAPPVDDDAPPVSPPVGGNIPPSAPPEDAPPDHASASVADGVAPVGHEVVSEIDFESDVDEGEVTVESVAELPTGVDEPEAFVSAVEIDVPEALTDEPASIEFAVDRSDLAGEDPEDVRLAHHHDGEWTLLETELVDSEGAQLRYVAQTDGFSVFAVTTVGDDEPPSDGPPPETDDADDADDDEPADEPGGIDLSTLGAVVALLAAVVVGLAAYRYRTRDDRS